MRDTESNLDYFGARYNSSTMGRFVTPDWATTPIDVPYADFGDPQSLNLYSYVKNNPTTTRDADGHCAEAFTCSLEFGVGGSSLGPIGTAVGAIVGAGVGLYIEYKGLQALNNYIHRSDNQSGTPPATNQGGGEQQQQAQPGSSGGPTAGQRFTPEQRARMQARIAIIAADRRQKSPDMRTPARPITQIRGLVEATLNQRTRTRPAERAIARKDLRTFRNSRLAEGTPRQSAPCSRHACTSAQADSQRGRNWGRSRELMFIAVAAQQRIPTPETGLMLWREEMAMTETQKEMLKVQFYDRDIGYENLWATYLGENLYRLETVPFFVYGVSRNDIVLARPDTGGRLQFVRIVKPSGNRTLRARPEQFTVDEQRGTELVRKLKALGCTVELSTPRLVAVDVPKTVDIDAVTNFLTSAGIPWEYANPTLEELNKRVGDA